MTHDNIKIEFAYNDCNVSVVYVSNDTYVIEKTCDPNTIYDFDTVYDILYEYAEEYGIDMRNITDSDDESVRYNDLVNFLNDRVIQSDEEDNVFYIDEYRLFRP